MIQNLTKNEVIAKRPVFASSMLMRCRGMIGRSFDSFDAMIFEGCNMVHTMFMSIPLDLIFIDKNNAVKRLAMHVKPWRPMIRCGKAVTVIEMADGILECLNIEEGDILDLNAVHAESPQTMNKGILPSSVEPVIPLNESR